MAINKTWHEHNIMPKNADMDFRIKWHQEHQVQCGCRAIPAKVLAAIEQQKSQRTTKAARKGP